jgi:hypothetical protein
LALNVLQQFYAFGGEPFSHGHARDALLVRAEVADKQFAQRKDHSQADPVT